MKSKILKGMAVMALMMVSLLSVMPANGQNQQSKQYEELLDIVVMENINSMNVDKMFQVQFQPLVEQGTIKQAQADSIIKDMKAFLVPAIKELTKQAYREELSYDDLLALSQWMKTSTYKKIAALTPRSQELLVEYMKTPEWSEEINKIVTRHIQ